MPDICQVPKCRQSADLIYLGKGVCNKCYDKHCEGKINLKEIFNIGVKENGKSIKTTV